MIEKDPKVTFDLVEKTIHTTGRINAAQMFLEFVQLRRSQFDSVHSYITRLKTLKTRLFIALAQSTVLPLYFPRRDVHV